MLIVVNANDEQKEEFLSKKIPEQITLVWSNQTIAHADIYFDLLLDENGAVFTNVTQLVFANSVIKTCAALPENYVRMNAWNGFLKREYIEIAASEKNKAAADKLLNTLHWKYKYVPDEPGMIAPRIIAMIINEAYFALEDKISSKEEIDIAMKLGTNYPYGPFEWSKKIGLKKIYLLLTELSKQDKRYQPSLLLKNEATL